MKITEEKELERAISAIDWREIHRLRVNHESGWSVWLYWDGVSVSSTVENPGTTPGPYNEVFAILLCDIDNTDYEEGWAKQLEDPEKYRNLETGTILSEEEMVNEAIDGGDFSSAYQYWADEIRRDFHDERR